MELKAKPFGISDRLHELINNLSEMQNAFQKGKEEIELSTVNFVTPISILPLAVYANNNGMRINTTEDPYSDACSYLDTICFQQGVTEFQKENKRYLPITRLPTTESCKLLGEYEDRMLSQTGVEKVVLKHLTSELVNNVREHAQVNQYWLLAQTYKTTHLIVEIVLADCGMGYKNSYKGSRFEVEDDASAIINALEGRSSKTELNGRGFGIPSIVRIFAGALSGKLIIMSGESMMYYKDGKRKELPLKSYWQGALVGINFTPKPIDIYKYIE
jgi:hypothetical protein